MLQTNTLITMNTLHIRIFNHNSLLWHLITVIPTFILQASECFDINCRDIVYHHIFPKVLEFVPHLIYWTKDWNNVKLFLKKLESQLPTRLHRDCTAFSGPGSNSDPTDPISPCKDCLNVFKAH